jgi:pimeloyl-ACP methyl ester carboxylesterase
MSSSARIRLVAVVALLVVVGAVLVLLTRPKSAPESEPKVTDFYAAPADVPAKPGVLIRSEEVFGGVPEGAEAWRILYTTTRDKGEPAIASGLVMVKKGVSGKRPVIAWAHGTTGVAQACAPSKETNAITFGSIPGVTEVVDKGWVVVATDYVGLGTPGPHPYLIGEGEGRSVLDAVRAAHQFSSVSLQDETVLWGHSQGGHAALWAAILAPTYAKDVDVIGVAGVAPATDLVGLAGNLVRTKGGVVFSAYLISSYADAYRDIRFASYVKPAALDPLREMADHCVTDIQPLIALAQEPALVGDYYSRDPGSGALGEHLAANNPSGRITVPQFIGQGGKDVLVIPAVQAAYVAGRCAESGNGPLDYQTYPDRTHVDVIAPDSDLVPDLIAWTSARFAGKAAPTTCG